METTADIRFFRLPARTTCLLSRCELLSETGMSKLSKHLTY